MASGGEDVSVAPPRPGPASAMPQWKLSILRVAHLFVTLLMLLTLSFLLLGAVFSIFSSGEGTVLHIADDGLDLETKQRNPRGLGKNLRTLTSSLSCKKKTKFFELGRFVIS